MEVQKRYMMMAFELAKINACKTAPNPWVGAVIVKNGKVIGQGFHLGAGFPHAEIEAINSAKESVRGADIYVSLQPCNTYGRTPPCIDAIKKAGIRKVFFSVYDPNINQEKYNSEGVFGGVLEEEGKKILLPYLVYAREKRPYIIVKLAQTLDGKIADTWGKSKYITCRKSIELVHILRAKVNAVVIGEKTLQKDKPILNTRFLPKWYLRKIQNAKNIIGGYYPDPIRVILDSDFSSVESDIPEGNNIIFLGRADLKRDFRVDRISFATLPSTKPKDIAEFLYKIGVICVLVEGGGKTAWKFLEEDMFDELWVFIAPKILGGGLSVGNGFLPLEKAKNLKIGEIRKTGDDVLLRLSRGVLWDVF